jgi:hypothetical protein
MTTKSTSTIDTKSTVEAKLADLERQRDALPDPVTLEREVAAAYQRRSAFDVQMQTIRSAVATLANVEPRIVAEQKWQDFLTTARKTCCDELLAMPPRRDDRELGRARNLELSIAKIDRDVVVDPWTLETLRLGELIREAGYVEGPKIENQVYGRLPWFGSLPEVERRLKALQEERSIAQARLDEVTS